jgi:hypothetical protein
MASFDPLLAGPIGTGRQRFALVACVASIAVLTACGPSPEQESAQRAMAIAYAQATSTAIAAPTVAARQTADALASATSVEATVQAAASRTALAQATQQALVVDARVHAAVAATQAAAPTAIPPTQTPVPERQRPAVIIIAQPTPAPVYIPVPMLAPVYVQSETPFWTAQVAASSTQGAAESIASRLRSRGLAGETLFSSNYSSLTPGYWVTYSGKFDDRATADQQVQRVRSVGFSDAFAREVRQ